jgi:serine/threonine protein kinase/dienelactone hydrolase
MGISPEQWEKVKEIYETAFECNPLQRTAYVNRQTNDDLVRAEVLRLLADSDSVGSFLSTPPFVDSRSTHTEVHERLVEGQVLSGRFRIVSFVAAGGMGEVYKAEDTRLGRIVVLKFLPKKLSEDSVSLELFRQEAKAASALNHPNICTVYDFGDDAGRAFIAMEYLEGETLSTRLKSGSLPLKDALKTAFEVSSALNAAHRKGIVHRDIKPGNIMLISSGAKLLDFGLAKHETPVTAVGDVEDCFTGEAAVVGTLSYMSPEQLQGKDVDARGDIFSFGVVLYEMLTGRRALQRKPQANSIVDAKNEAPRPIREFTKGVPDEVEALIRRCLLTRPADRYQSMNEVLQQLQESYEMVKEPVGGVRLRALLRQMKRPLIAIPLLLGVIVVLGGLAYWINQSRKIAWAKEQALPQISELIKQDKILEAYNLAEEAERYIPQDPALQKVWPDTSWSDSISTLPPGASVYRRKYNAPNSPWEFVGLTPIKKRRFAAVDSSWKFEMPGYKTVERETFPAFLFSPTVVTLDKEQSIPVGMVRVDLTTPDGKPPEVGLYGLPGLETSPTIPIESYWIDRYEVTNSEFKRFVDEGGYQKPDFWKQEFRKDGHLFTWSDAMKLFRDSTGKPGPATWSDGKYPAGEDNYPVTGVSWFEAAAYAEFAGKALPTIYHWRVAARPANGPSLIPASNFRGQGPAAVGTYQGISSFGVYDMAGNAKEWVFNDDGSGKHFILGGAWNEPSYTFYDADARSPFQRAGNFGFRCAKYMSNKDVEQAANPIIAQVRNYDSEKPVSDQLFEAYRSLYSYDKTALNAQVETILQTDGWREEKITFDAAYANERVIAYLFMPAKVKPPYQTVVIFPPGGALHDQSSADLGPHGYFDAIEFMLKSGRAIMYPIYKGTFERGANPDSSPWPNTTSTYRDRMIMWSKDLGRSIDYLETRPDIDHEKLAYEGYSLGAALGSLLPGVEHRFKALVLICGGFWLQKRLPEADQINFAPRVKAPVLMLSGRFDYIFPVRSSQEPMFRFLGTPKEHKRQVLYDVGHDVPDNELVKETLSWLDRYLGPVK